MISTLAQKTNTLATMPRRLRAMALTLLFAFCVLVASAPHRHAGDTPTAEAAQAARVSSSRLNTAHAFAARLQTADASCPLCDWLYAPTLPAAAPVLPPLASPLRRFVLAPAAPTGRLLAAAPSRSSSRAPPTV